MHWSGCRPNEVVKVFKQPWIRRVKLTELENMDPALKCDYVIELDADKFDTKTGESYVWLVNDHEGELLKERLESKNKHD